MGWFDLILEYWDIILWKIHLQDTLYHCQNYRLHSSASYMILLDDFSQIHTTTILEVRVIFCYMPVWVRHGQYTRTHLLPTAPISVCSLSRMLLHIIIVYTKSTIAAYFSFQTILLFKRQYTFGNKANLGLQRYTRWLADPWKDSSNKIMLLWYSYKFGFSNL